VFGHADCNHAKQAKIKLAKETLILAPGNMAWAYGIAKTAGLCRTCSQDLKTMENQPMTLTSIPDYSDISALIAIGSY